MNVKKKKIKYEMSESEQMIMKYLWKNPEGKLFPDIVEYLNNTYEKNWAKQTINTFILRLADKGLIYVEKKSRQSTYYAAVTQEEYHRGEAQAYLDLYHHGSLTNFISALTGGGEIDSKTADKLKKILNDNNQEN